MTWTDPTTRQTGDLITATIWNQDVVDNLAYLGALEAGGLALSDGATDDLSRIATGSYTGNNNDNRSITGVGFSPKAVWIYRADSDVGTFKYWASPADSAIKFQGSNGFGALAANNIQALESDRFQIGTDSRVNYSGSPYYWVAWG